MDIRDYMEISLEKDNRRLAAYKGSCEEWGRLSYKLAGSDRLRYYYLTGKDGIRKYIGGDNHPKVKRIQRAKFSNILCEALKNNIKLKEDFIKKYRPCEVADIMEKLSKAYWNEVNPLSPSTNSPPPSEHPMYREQLKIRTSFGLMVRTRAEAAIAELLYSSGVEWYYEKALQLMRPEQENSWTTVYPDFTVMTKSGTPIYIEHKGLLTNPEYAKRDGERTMLYACNNIYQPHNLIVTSEGKEGDMDMEAVKAMVDYVVVRAGVW